MNPRTRNRLYSLLFHPAMLALPVAILNILLMPDFFSKYNIEHLYERELSPGQTIEYHDLNHDGVSEYFYAAPDDVGGSGIAVYSLENRPLFHPTFKGKFPGASSRCIVGDYDNDGNDEIFALTVDGDSCLMNAISFKERGRLIFRDRFIATIHPYNDTIHIMFAPHFLTDLTGDGYREVIFELHNGYGVIPRRIFAWDVKNDLVFSSPELGGLGGISDTADIDNDGKPEFTITNYGPGNITDTSAALQDNCGYVMALDHDLQFLFPPVIIPGLYSSAINCFIRDKNEYFIASYSNDTGKIVRPVPLKIYSLNGKLVEERAFKKDYSLNTWFIQKITGKRNQTCFLKFRNGEFIRVYDQDLHLIRKIKYRSGHNEIFTFDFDHDGEKELLFRSSHADYWVLMRNSFDHPVEFMLPDVKSTPLFFNVLNGDNKPRFCVNSGERLFFFQYGYNALYPLRFAVYLAIYILVVTFILLIQYLQRIQLQKKEETRKHLTELQLNSIHSQMDSHFTFNVLNTIGSAIMQDEKEKAYTLLGRFSRLLRATLSGSDSVSRTLKEELEFVDNFLQIQQNRFIGLFEYSISVEASVDMLQPVPRGCIQTHVENAVKHGLTPKMHGGLLTIKIGTNADCLEIVITDNGVGRVQALKNSSDSTGKGLQIMHQYYELLNKQNREPILETTDDLYDENGKASGTEVRIRVPLGFRFY